MTNEEAIRYFKRHIDLYCVDGISREAEEMAIKALEQQPCKNEYIKVPKKALKYRTAGMVAYNAEWLKNHFDIERTVICGTQEPITTTNNNEPITVIYPTIVCDDAISRQAVLDLINDQKDAFYSNGDKCLFESYVNELPSATPKQKYGKWIKHPEIETSTPEYLMFYECSECGDKQCFCKSDLHKKRFCNSCGAKMQESEE